MADAETTEDEPTTVGTWLEELTAVSSEILQGIVGGDRYAALRVAARRTQHLLQAESCAVFLVPEDRPGHLVLAASWTDLRDDRFEPVTIEIRDGPGAGLTSFIALHGGVVELHGEPLRSHPCLAGRRTPDHLTSSRCHSLLGIPLSDRKGLLLGLIKYENKKDPDGKAGPDVFFSKEDQSTAVIIANQIVAMIESVRASNVSAELVRVIGSPIGAADLLSELLEKCLHLLRADRGSIAFWDVDRRDLIIGPERGPGGLGAGMPVPPGSVLRKVWETGVHHIATSTEGSGEASDRADRRSSVSVRLEWEGERIGVLEAESSHKNAFDQKDIDALEVLSRFAVIAYRAVDRQATTRRLFQARDRGPLPQRILDCILDSLLGIFDVEGGIIYFIDPPRRKLWCDTYKAKKPLPLGNPRDFSYEVDEASLATEVFRSGKRVGARHPNDPRVNQKGVRAFHIQGPILGEPLWKANEVVGVLVVWQSAERVGQEPEIPLEPFARLAATTISLSQSEVQRHNTLGTLLRVVNRMRKGLRERELLRLAMEGLRDAGFDRIRVFLYHEEPARFVVVDSLGMENPEGIRNYTIFVDRNRYAEDTAKTAATEPTARVYDPSRLGWGPDPDAVAIGKPLDLPWAVVPIVLGTKLYGQIVADNLPSRREISDESLEYMTIFSAIAARAIADTTVKDALRSGGLRTLFDHLKPDDTRGTVIRKLLVYVTAKEGLAFSRGLFLKSNDDGRRFVFCEGLGSITHERFTTVSKAAEDLGIPAILDGAESLHDAALTKAMADFTIEAADPAIRVIVDEEHASELSLSRSDGFGAAPAWASELSHRLDADRIIVAPLKLSRKVLGLFIADRRWQQREIDELDRWSLTTFAREAAEILQRQELQDRVRYRDLETLGSVALGLTHQLMQPLHRLKVDTETLRRQVGRIPITAPNSRILETAARIHDGTGHLVKTVEALKCLVQPKDRIVSVEIPVLLEELLALVKTRAENHGIRVSSSTKPGTPAVQAIPGLLLQALINLFRNAENALELCDRPHPLIEVSAGIEGGCVILGVRDNGTGIAMEHLEEIRKGRFVTTNPLKGLGLGLSIVRKVAEVHGGDFSIDSVMGGWTHAKISFPARVQQADHDAGPSAANPSSAPLSGDPATPATGPNAGPHAADSGGETSGSDRGV